MMSSGPQVCLFFQFPLLLPCWLWILCNCFPSLPVAADSLELPASKAERSQGQGFIYLFKNMYLFTYLAAWGLSCIQVESWRTVRVGALGVNCCAPFGCCTGLWWPTTALSPETHQLEKPLHWEMHKRFLSPCPCNGEDTIVYCCKTKPDSLL